MKKNFKLLFLAAILSVSATMVFLSCKKDKDDTPSTENCIPDKTSSYWNDWYRQNQLNGRAKTVTHKIANHDEYDSFYNVMEFDAKGNLLKDCKYNREDPTNYYGNSFQYDAQNRLVKIIMGNNTRPEYEFIECSYSGAHTAYIPTHIIGFRFQKGVTSIKYTYDDEVYFDFKFKSASCADNSVHFAGTFMGKGTAEINIPCVGNLPKDIALSATNPEGETISGTLYSATYGADGMFERISYYNNDGINVDYTEDYTTIAGFMLLTKEYRPSQPDRTVEIEYNDKGFEVHRVDKVNEFRYVDYQYDSHGNWTERTREYNDGGNWKYYKTETREITYWD